MNYEKLAQPLQASRAKQVKLKANAEARIAAVAARFPRRTQAYLADSGTLWWSIFMRSPGIFHVGPVE